MGIRRALIALDATPGTNALSIARGFVDLGIETRLIDLGRSVAPRIGSPEWLSLQRVGRVSTAENARVANQIKEATTGWAPDVTIAMKPIFYDQEMFLSTKAPLAAVISFDDVSNPDNITAGYLLTEHRWSIVFTTKRHNIQELARRGAQNVHYLWSAHDPARSRVTVPFHKRRYTLGFIGAARPDRANLPTTVASRIPGESIIYGPRWRRSYPIPPRGVALRGAVQSAKYTAAANSFKIGLVLLNSDNRDQHTNRTFEAPACGQLALAKRTPEHEFLFDHGTTALLFDDLEDALELAAKFAREPGRAQNIAAAGQQLISMGGHTFTDRAREMLSALEEL